MSPAEDFPPEHALVKQHVCPRLEEFMAGGYFLLGFTEVATHSGQRRLAPIAFSNFSVESLPDFLTQGDPEAELVLSYYRNLAFTVAQLNAAYEKGLFLIDKQKSQNGLL